MNELCTDFGGQKARKMCHGGNDIGRACNMSHAEQVAGRKYGHGIFSVSWLELATLEFERFFEKKRWRESGERGKSGAMREKMWTSVRLTVVKLGKERKRRW